MKRVIPFLLVFFLLSVPSLLASEQETAEMLLAWAAETMKQMKEKGYDMQFVNPEAAGQIFYLKNQHYIQMEGTFSPGNAFFFLCADGRQAKSVGIQILDEAGNVVNEHVPGENHAVGVLEPERTGTYYIRIILLETTGVPAAHVGYVLLYVKTQ